MSQKSGSMDLYGALTLNHFSGNSGTYKGTLCTIQPNFRFQHKNASGMVEIMFVVVPLYVHHSNYNMEIVLQIYTYKNYQFLQINTKYWSVLVLQRGMMYADVNLCEKHKYQISITSV